MSSSNIIRTLTFLLVLTCSEGNKSEESDEEFFLRDGTPVPNAILHSLMMCRAIKSSKVSAVSKIFIHFREECAEEVHRMKLGSKLKESACRLSCVLKKIHIVTSGNKLIDDQDKLLHSIRAVGMATDGDKAAKLAKKATMCAKLSPPYKEKNCFSIVPYGFCMYYAIKEVCHVD